MMSFLRRAMAAGLIEDLTVIHEGPNKHVYCNGISYSTRYTPRKLRVEQSLGTPDPTIRVLLDSLLNVEKRDL